MKIAVLGGSGKLGRGLASRLGMHEILIGSRDSAKGVSYLTASEWCELAILAIPYAAHDNLLGSIRDSMRNKIVIDATVPLDPADPTRVLSATGRSAAEESAAILVGAHVFAAFQTISHRVLQTPGRVADVLVAGGPAGMDIVVELIRGMNLRPIQAGSLQIAGSIERLTALLISINKANKVKESSLRIEGLP
jgi:8-hydroxy-5-deazaflavin:NADPH oxidoreductase